MSIQPAQGESLPTFAVRYLLENMAAIAVAGFIYAAATFPWLLLAVTDSHVLGYSVLAIATMAVYMGLDITGGDRGTGSAEEGGRHWLVNLVDIAAVVIIMNFVVAFAATFGYAFATEVSPTVGILVAMLYPLWEVVSVENDYAVIPLSLFGIVIWTITVLMAISDTAARLIRYFELDDLTIEKLPGPLISRPRRR